MTNTISSRTDNRNFASTLRREGVVVDSTTNPSNNSSEQNFITLREARHLADLGVELNRDMFISLITSPINQAQGRCLQFGRILY